MKDYVSSAYRTLIRLILSYTNNAMMYDVTLCRCLRTSTDYVLINTNQIYRLSDTFHCTEGKQTRKRLMCMCMYVPIVPKYIFI